MFSLVIEWLDSLLQEVGKQLAATAKSTKAKTARFAVCGTAGSNALQVLF